MLNTVETEQLKKQMAEIEWYHRIDLGSELGTTPGICPDDSVRLSYMNIPNDLHGMTVLDVGAWDGKFAFEAERNGAARVLATDIWGHYTMGKENLFNSGEGILFASTVLKSKIQLLNCSIADMPEAIWDADPGARFDLILCAGVVYHLQNPLQALVNLERLLAPDGLLILETHLDLLSLDRPAIALYPSNECAEDPTNYCGPNRAAVETLLRWAGFSDIRFQGGINLSAWPELQTVNYGRGAWHARR